ncbi:MAG TPA: HlyD family secretion protein [Bryobacteraceae bacterium]|jgi:membrane fusion protein (multidrug efflux system)|nr:HlyD family secretion protein [Bryobacteraceae bacterium]
MADDQQPQGGQDSAQKRPPERKKRPEDPRRKRTVRLVALAVLVVAIIAAIPIWAYYSVRESTDDAQVDGHLIPISPRISGVIITVLVNDNQPVKAGDELVRLDPADFQVAQAQAEANLANAEASTQQSEVNLPLTNISTRSQVSTTSAQVQEGRAGVAAAEQAVNVARARVSSANFALQQAQANYTKSQNDLQRYRELVAKDEISKQDYDAAVAAATGTAAQVDSAKSAIAEAQHTLDQAGAQLAQARARLASAQVSERESQESRPHQVAASQAQYKSAQAMVKQSQANLEQAKLNLGYTILRAPVDGVVSRKNAEPGMHVSAGQQLMALVPLDDVWVTANFKETQLRKMRVGQKVDIEVDTYGSSRKFRAHVDSIAAGSGARFSLLPPENATGNFVKVVQRVPVKIVLEPGENRDHLLLPGMSVTPTVFLNSGTNSAY